jgi:hypothetical protein
MNKTVIFLLLLWLTLNVSAQVCVDCAVQLISIDHKIPFGAKDEITIFLEFKNVGTETCCYKAKLYNIDGDLLEDEPDVIWEKVEPEETGKITLNSNWDWTWNICDLDSGLGTGLFDIELIAVVRPSIFRGGCTNPDEPECHTIPPIVDDYTFTPMPTECCKYEGKGCLEYDTTYGGFACEDPVQINVDVPCLVSCVYDPVADACSCVLQDACAIACITEEDSHCQFGDFICDGPYYRCQVAAASPEVRCSTTNDCRYQCAAECGKKTNCMKDCETCCSTTTCLKIFPFTYEKAQLDVCMDACRGICRTNEQLCSIIQILQMIATAASTLLIMVHGFRWMTADDMEGIQDAKRGIVYVLMGLMLVVTATLLANYFLLGSLVC